MKSQKDTALDEVAIASARLRDARSLDELAHRSRSGIPRNEAIKAARMVEARAEAAARRAGATSDEITWWREPYGEGMVIETSR